MSIEGEIWEERYEKSRAATKTAVLAAVAEITRRITERLQPAIPLGHCPMSNEEMTKVIMMFIDSAEEGLG